MKAKTTVRDDGSIQVILEEDTPAGVFRDALYFSGEQYKEITPEQLEAQMRERVNNWLAMVYPPPDVAGAAPSSGGCGSFTRTIIDNYDPPELFRFFEDESHADALCEGTVWISTFARCRHYEDPDQGDAREGFLTYRPGVDGKSTDAHMQPILQRLRRLGMNVEGPNATLHVSGATIQQVVPHAYVLCFAQSKIPSGVAGSGTYGVRIRKPRRVFKRLTDALFAQIGSVNAAFGRVTYSDREFRSSEPVPGFAAFVKPSRYSHQDEARMVWVPQGPASARALECRAIMGLCSRI